MSEKDNLIAALILSANVLSFLAVGLVIWCFIHNKKLREDPDFTYIIFICGSDFIWSVIMIIDSILSLTGIKFSNFFCNLEGFFKVYFGLAEFFTIGAYCYILRDFIIKGSNLKSKYKNYIITCFFLPLVFSIM
jgi:hypothetical protein